MTVEGTDMNCRDFVGHLLDYLVGTLTREQLDALEAHLADCSECVKYLRSYRATVELTKGAFVDEPRPTPADLIRALLHRH